MSAETARILRERMVSQMPDLEAPWPAIFERVPRHVFVPRIVGCWPPESEDSSSAAEVTIDAEHDPGRWLELVYSNRLLIVVNDEQAHRRSSSSMPSAMASFLHLLDLEDGNRVLEIGTGTGYNAALLCERLGDGLVASVDVDPELVEAARTALASCGYAPTLAATDGLSGYPPRAPYDRIIATCSVPRIPPAWAEQLAPDGVIVAPMKNGMLVGLHQEQDGRLVGPADPASVSFMPLLSPGWPPEPSWAPLAETPEWRTVTEPEGWALSAGVRLHASLLMPDLEMAFQDGDWSLASPPDGSWARLVRGADGVLWLAQAGARRLWDEYQAAALAWVGLGRPGPQRYGLTVCPDGSHRIWLDRPDSGLVWELPGFLPPPARSTPPARTS